MTYYNDTLETERSVKRLTRMEPNTNPETGIRYGIISSQSLHSEIIHEIQSIGSDIYFEEACDDIRMSLEGVLRDYMPKENIDEIAEDAINRFGENYEHDEPVHEFILNGVKGRTTWLGGALHVWIFDSPYLTHRGLCSPCVPNCGDLDSKFNDEGGYKCYDVPPDWRDEE
jgi:hypothetical protein